MLHLTTEQFQRIVEQGRAGKPLEICGLMAGTRTGDAQNEVTQVIEVYPIESEDKSALTYTMNPLQQLRVEKEVQARGLQVVGIYHTHPATQAYPSPTDVAQAHWGEWDDLRFPGYSYLIVSLRDPEQPEPHSFKIIGRRIPEDILEEPVVIA
ncbi:MAG: M67 family metallopeptidase [Abitibacteriaceae bacterium]|nr:M67 family metallopeptidase [Abditibacteriaceae bacterium]